MRKKQDWTFPLTQSDGVASLVKLQVNAHYWIKKSWIFPFHQGTKGHLSTSVSCFTCFLHPTIFSFISLTLHKGMHTNTLCNSLF